MSRKQVLFVVKQNSMHFKDAVLEYAEKAGWNLEFYSGGVPRGWYGDGVIVDTVTWEELQVISNVDTIPIVGCRRLPQRDNIRIVLGNVQSIAQIAADCFISRGFKHFASFAGYQRRNQTEQELTTYMPDWALRQELEKRGFSLNMLFLGQEDSLPNDFRANIEKMRQFLNNLPKPCACFTTNIRNSHLFYRACEEEHINVPEEIAFLANNDFPEISEHTKPTTSTIVGEIRNVGHCLAQTLDDMMNGIPVDPIPKRMEPVGIIYRQSTDILAVPHLQAAEAINFLLRNYMNPISIADAADYAGIHTDTMNTLFKKHIHKTPARLLCEIRMSEAKDLLTNTTLSLSKIATQVGYGSAMAFHLAFKREFSVTPGHFRCQMQH